jgi:serine/threonine protein kinase
VFVLDPEAPSSILFLCPVSFAFRSHLSSIQPSFHLIFLMAHAAAGAVVVAPRKFAWLLRDADVTLQRDASGQPIEEGRGGFAVVYRGMYRGKPVAIKQLLAPSLTKRAQEAFEVEVETMWSLAHPCVVRVIGAIMEPRKYAIVMELCTGGDLFKYLRAVELDRVSWTQRMLWLFEIAHGLDFLHQKRVAHRDLKSANCILSADGRHVKLSDFGLADTKNESQSTMGAHQGNVVGTIRWLPPEVFHAAARLSYLAVDVCK